jgi:hypothetical protein
LDNHKKSINVPVEKFCDSMIALRASLASGYTQIDASSEVAKNLAIEASLNKPFAQFG